MKFYLTSSPCVENGRLNPANHFVDNIRQDLTGVTKALFVASDPDDFIHMDRFGKEIRKSFEWSGIYFSQYLILDHRNAKNAKALVAEAQFIILAGGHVPTQNRFFQSIGLKRLLKSFSGVLLGISAGSMNAASIVYAQPELEGESTDPNYHRFLTYGLGITKCHILPHYNQLKGSRLDGKLLYEEITMEDTLKESFYVFEDGTYLTNRNGQEEIYGQTFLMEHYQMREICHSNQVISFPYVGKQIVSGD